MATVILKPAIYPTEARAGRGGQGPLTWVSCVWKIVPAEDLEMIVWKSPRSVESPLAALRFAETAVRMICHDLRHQLPLALQTP